MPRFMIITGCSCDDFSEASMSIETVDFDRLVAWLAELRRHKLGGVVEDRIRCKEQHQKEDKRQYGYDNIEAHYQARLERYDAWESVVMEQFGEKYAEWARTARPGDRMDGPSLDEYSYVTMLLAVPDDWPVDPVTEE